MTDLEIGFSAGSADDLITSQQRSDLAIDPPFTPAATEPPTAYLTITPTESV